MKQKWVWRYLESPALESKDRGQPSLQSRFRVSERPHPSPPKIKQGLYPNDDADFRGLPLICPYAGAHMNLYIYVHLNM